MPNKNINLVDQKIALEKVLFERKDFVESFPKVDIKDKIEKVNISGQSINFEFHRVVKLIPSSIFTVEVVFSYSSIIENESFKMLQEEKRELKNADLINIVNNTNIPQTASMVISNLTCINSANPLVTPPMFIKE